MSIDYYAKAHCLVSENKVEVNGLKGIVLFNCRLADMLISKDKLQSILTLRKQYSVNKEVIRYHAIYLVQQRISSELETYIEGHKVSKKDQLIN